MSRQPLVVANWKMHKTGAEAHDFVTGLAVTYLPGSVEIVICPSFTSLAAAADALQGRKWSLGAQNCHQETAGAFTGEVSAGQLAAAGCRYVILGHSERRQLFGETDDLVQQKLQAALAAGLQPILCVGETAAERADGHTEAVVATQVRAACTGLGADGFAKLVVAYEPVWAIGTGQTATAADAQAVAKHIRGLLAELGGEAAAAGIRVLYGGSVNGDNAAGFASQPDIDGALVGGASLQPLGFSGIVRAFAK